MRVVFDARIALNDRTCVDDYAASDLSIGVNDGLREYDGARRQYGACSDVRMRMDDRCEIESLGEEPLASFAS